MITFVQQHITREGEEPLLLAAYLQIFDPMSRRDTLLVIVPRQLGNALAQQESVKILEPPVPLPTYKVKQHWHERYNADAGNIWLRQVMMALFAGKASGSNP